jgi:hypothetical protein
MESHLFKAQFARRHLYKLVAVGAAALLAKTAMPTPAKARGPYNPDSDCGEYCFLKGDSDHHGLRRAAD